MGFSVSEGNFWNPVLPLEVLSNHVDRLCLSLSHVCLLPALLYTTFEMASPAGREEAPVLLANCFLSVLSSLTITDILWHNRHHDLGDHQS